MRKITEFSVKYPVTVSMIVLGVLLLGYISYSKLGIELFPNMNNPKLYIEFKAGERPPEEMENQYVKNIEALAIRQSDVVNVSSISQTGRAQITVEYAWDKDMNNAFLDLQKAVNTFTQNNDNIEELSILDYDPNTSPVVEIAIGSQSVTDMNELRKLAENHIRNQLIRIEGIADVEINGDQKQEIYIETKQYYLDSYALSLDDISTAIQNFNQSISGGNIEELGTKYVVKGVSLLNQVDDFKQVIVGYKSVDSSNEKANSTPIFLQEVAEISLKDKESENIVRLNEVQSLGLSVYKETGYNTVKAVENVTKAIDEIKKALPSYTLNIVSNQGVYIESAINDVMDSALLGIALAVIILFVFLRRIGSTLIISIAIPISIVATFNLMYFNGLTMNIMSLGGLSLGAGMLVDNAIVVVENIFRSRDNGMSAIEAAVKGTSQVSGAIVASTLTTIVVFLPIVYLQGSSGELFKDQAWTVAFSLLSSLVVAVLVIPMLFSLFYKGKKEKEVATVEIKGYGKLLEKLLDKRWLIIIIALLVQAGTFALIPSIGSQFMPKSESNQFSMGITLAEGTQLQRTNSTVINIEQIAKEILADNLQYTYSKVGPMNTISAGTSSIFEGENTAKIQFTLSENSTVSSNEAIEILSASFGDLPDMEVYYTMDETAMSSILGTNQAPLIIEVEGDDISEIENILTQVEKRLHSVENVYNIESSMANGTPEVELRIDKMRAGMHGLSVSSIASQVEAVLSGKAVGQIERNGEMLDITLKLPDMSLNDLRKVKISSGSNEYYLEELANINLGYSPKEIQRNNQVRVGSITAQIADGVSLSKVANNIERAIAEFDLPSGYKINITGEEELRKKSMEGLNFALILSIILVFMVLASQFESLLHPFTIILTIPLAVVGSILCFFIFQKPFDVMGFIGLIMLAGIAVNNSIILIDRALQLQRAGASRREAIIQAGQQRIRPILMTSITTILALLPLTIKIGGGSTLSSSMAMAVIGGIFTSTLLSLVVIPCVYDVFEGMKQRLVGNREQQD